MVMMEMLEISLILKEEMNPDEQTCWITLPSHMKDSMLT